MVSLEKSSSLLYLGIVFAPVALLMQYEEIDDAIELANGTRYGLGASVFGPDQEECMKVARRLECGMVSINDFGVFYVSLRIRNIVHLLTPLQLK